MAELTLDVARKILDAALAKGVEKKFKPLVITILDARGAVKVTAAQDGTSLMRAEIAHGKAYGALALGMGSRALFQRAQEQAYFVNAVNAIAQGRLVPVPGGVLIAESIHPNKSHIGGRGINTLTGADVVAPIGGAPFHDNKVWLKKAAASARKS